MPFQILQNQVTIFLYNISNIDLILLSKDDKEYKNRNNPSRINKIISQLKKSPQFVKHLHKREYGYNDKISSEELWQILQEEVIRKIITDLLKRSLESNR